MNNSFICHSCTHISVSKCVFATFLLPCFACRRVPTLCACPSHTSRSVHLYVSETSLEIDSSDGMISDASTKDSSSSEEEGPSSDDEDDGDDSDWGRVGYYDNNNNNNNTEVKPDRKPAREMPTWPLWVKIQDSAERRQHEECTSAAAAALSEATVSESELKKKREGWVSVFAGRKNMFGAMPLKLIKASKLNCVCRDMLLKELRKYSREMLRQFSRDYEVRGVMKLEAALVSVMKGRKGDNLCPISASFTGFLKHGCSWSPRTDSGENSTITFKG